MPKSKPPYRAEFRKQMVDLFHAGRSASELSREFGVSTQSISTWVAQAAADGEKPRSNKGRGDLRGTGGAIPLASSGAAARRMCRVLKVSASDWLSRRPSRRVLANAVLVEQIRAIHTESDGTYGMPRVRAELIDRDVHVSRKRIAMLMRGHGICGVSRRCGFVVTTRWDQRLRQPRT